MTVVAIAGAFALGAVIGGWLVWIGTTCRFDP